MNVLLGDAVRSVEGIDWKNLYRSDMSPKGTLSLLTTRRGTLLTTSEVRKYMLKIHTKYAELFE